MGFFKEGDYGINPEDFKRTRVSVKDLYVIYDDILKIIETEPNVTNTKLGLMLEKSRAQTARYIKAMVNDGILESTRKYVAYVQNGFPKVYVTRTLEKKCNIKK